MSKLLRANAPVFGTNVARPAHDPSSVVSSPTRTPPLACDGRSAGTRVRGSERGSMLCSDQALVTAGDH